jgi:hypothetical protein
MTTTTTTAGSRPAQDLLAGRILTEGYGPGAWHGADFRAALADVDPAAAFWRPAPDRHNIAEIALHHAYCVWSLRGRLSGEAVEPFILAGEDWFPLSGSGDPTWDRVRATVESEQARLQDLVDGIAAGRRHSPLSAVERFDVVLGITCHAIYHAGQIQLLKVLGRASAS